MNKIKFQTPGNIEKNILEILSERDHVDFMSLRTFFPIEVTSIEKKCNDLIYLGLINKERIENKTQYVLTDLGVKAIINGLDHWIRQKVFDNIKNDLYVITKSTPIIERFAIRQLESEGKIYSDGNVYRVVPGEKINTKIPSIEVPKGNPHDIIDKIINDIYTLQIPFQHMEMEKTHKNDLRHVMNYLEENRIVKMGSDPLELTPLGFYVFQIGHDKWRGEKDREELIGEKIKNSHLQNQLQKKSDKNWVTKIGDWYTQHEKVINLTVAVVTIFGFILALFQFT